MRALAGLKRRFGQNHVNFREPTFEELPPLAFGPLAAFRALEEQEAAEANGGLHSEPRRFLWRLSRRSFQDRAGEVRGVICAAATFVRGDLWIWTERPRLVYLAVCAV